MTLDQYWGVCDTYSYNKTDCSCFIGGKQDISTDASVDCTPGFDELVGGQKYRPPSLTPLEQNFFKPLHYSNGLGVSSPHDTADLSVPDWMLSVDGGDFRSINVPAGGYNSDRQEEVS